MGLLVVGVQGHKKTLENSKTLMKIDVFVGLVVQVPVCRGGRSPPGTLGSCTTRHPKTSIFIRVFVFSNGF